MAVFALKYLIIMYLSLASPPKDTKPPFKFKDSPPGTVWLRDSVFIDVNPVKNIDYKEFLSFVQVAYNKELRDSFKNIPSYGISMENFRSYMRLCGADKDLAAKMKIPYEMTLSWSMNMDEYLNSPTYKNFPVVNVSYNQAIMYCQWRTDMVMLFYSVNSKNEKKREKYYKRIRYRLPTPSEWQYAMDKFGNNTFTNQVVYAGEKCATVEAIPQKKNLEFVYVPYNVAEMTSKEKLAVGMSWQDKDTLPNYSKSIEYWGPRDWLGFRCVCEIIEY